MQCPKCQHKMTACAEPSRGSTFCQEGGAILEGWSCVNCGKWLEPEYAPTMKTPAFIKYAFKESAASGSVIKVIEKNIDKIIALRQRKKSYREIVLMLDLPCSQVSLNKWFNRIYRADKAEVRG